MGKMLSDQWKVQQYKVVVCASSEALLNLIVSFRHRRKVQQYQLVVFASSETLLNVIAPCRHRISGTNFVFAQSSDAALILIFCSFE